MAYRQLTAREIAALEAHGCSAEDWRAVTVAPDFERASPESQGVSSAAIQRWIEACENDAATNRFGNGCCRTGRCP